VTRAWKGWSRLTLTVRLHAMRRGSASVQALGLGQAVAANGPSHCGRSSPMPAASESIRSLVPKIESEQLLGPRSSSTGSPTVNTVSTRPASRFASHACCAAANSSRTVRPISRIRRAPEAGHSPPGLLSDGAASGRRGWPSGHPGRGTRG
jgi:hypothetical protein